MSEPLPIVLVPGLLASARLYGQQLPWLWRFGQVTIADHTRDDSMAAIASRLLAAAPPRFALAGLSSGAAARSRSPSAGASPRSPTSSSRCSSTGHARRTRLYGGWCG